MRPWRRRSGQLCRRQPEPEAASGGNHLIITDNFISFRAVESKAAAMTCGLTMLALNEGVGLRQGTLKRRKLHGHRVMLETAWLSVFEKGTTV